MGLKSATPEKTKQLFRSASTAGVGKYNTEAGQEALAKRAPSYTMGSPRSHSYIRPTLSPGPQHYAEKSVAGKDALLKTSPSFSMGLKDATPDRMTRLFKAKSTADLGSYSPERSLTVKASPRYSMGSRVGSASARRAGASSASAAIAMSDSNQSVATKGIDSPGPGSYQPSTTPTSKEKASPRYTFKDRVPALKKTSESTPGPGAYSPSGSVSAAPTIAEASQTFLKSARKQTGAKMGKVEHTC